MKKLSLTLKTDRGEISCQGNPIDPTSLFQGRVVHAVEVVGAPAGASMRDGDILVVDPQATGGLCTITTMLPNGQPLTGTVVGLMRRYGFHDKPQPEATPEPDAQAAMMKKLLTRWDALTQQSKDTGEVAGMVARARDLRGLLSWHERTSKRSLKDQLFAEAGPTMRHMQGVLDKQSQQEIC